MKAFEAELTASDPLSSMPLIYWEVVVVEVSEWRVNQGAPSPYPPPRSLVRRYSHTLGSLALLERNVDKGKAGLGHLLGHIPQKQASGFCIVIKVTRLREEQSWGQPREIQCVKKERRPRHGLLPPTCFFTDPTQKTNPSQGFFSSLAYHVHRPCSQHAQALWVSTVRPSEPVLPPAQG